MLNHCSISLTVGLDIRFYHVPLVFHVNDHKIVTHFSRMLNCQHKMCHGRAKSINYYCIFSSFIRFTVGCRIWWRYVNLKTIVATCWSLWSDFTVKTFYYRGVELMTRGSDMARQNHLCGPQELWTSENLSNNIFRTSVMPNYVGF